MADPWDREHYERTATSRAFTCTPYDAGWDGSAHYGEDLTACAEIRAIVAEERALPGVSPWAQAVLDRMVGPLPMCGHYAFPRPLVDLVEAIGEECCPAFVAGCYTADPERKRRMADCCFCLDAWAKDAPLEAVQTELAWRGDPARDWPAIAARIYATLGEPTPEQRLLVRRLLHRLRWWIKSLVWEGDRRDRFLRDVYSGDIRGDEARYGAYGNSPFGDPYFAEIQVPEVAAMRDEILATVPDGQRMLDRIESTWLCAPKAFRYLERIIAQIGSVGALGVVDERPILDCEDTYPDFEAQGIWYQDFMATLSAWLDGNAEALPALGEPTPEKHWLARLLRHKLRLYEKHNPFGRLVGIRTGGRSGKARPG